MTARKEISFRFDLPGISRIRDGVCRRAFQPRAGLLDRAALKISCVRQMQTLVEDFLQYLRHGGMRRTKKLFPQREQFPIQQLSLGKPAVIPGPIAAIEKNLAGIMHCGPGFANR
jgi:hypothetical protein